MTYPSLYADGNLWPDRKVHLEPAVVEQLPALIGRDPRQMTVEQLNALGRFDPFVRWLPPRGQMWSTP